MSTDQFRSAAAAYLAGNKPAGDLVDCMAEHFPDVEAFRENDDLIIKGGGTKRTLTELIDDIVTLDD